MFVTTVCVGSEQDLAPGDSVAADEERYTALPRNVSDRVRSWLIRSSPTAPRTLEKARAVENYLRRSFSYDLNSPAGRSTDPLDDFLFASRRGHCEFYSSAMVVLLRELKFPRAT